MTTMKLILNSCLIKDKAITAPAVIHPVRADSPSISVNNPPGNPS